MNSPLCRTPRWIWRACGAGCALLLGGAALAAQDAPAPVRAVPAPAPAAAAVPTFTAFQAIGNYNIFNANRIGYAPGACLRAHLLRVGCSFSPILAAGWIDARGQDRFF